MHFFRGLPPQKTIQTTVSANDLEDHHRQGSDIDDG
jgi:hypothetical protein